MTNSQSGFVSWFDELIRFEVHAAIKMQTGFFLLVVPALTASFLIRI